MCFRCREKWQYGHKCKTKTRSPCHFWFLILTTWNSAQLLRTVIWIFLVFISWMDGSDLIFYMWMRMYVWIHLLHLKTTWNSQLEFYPTSTLNRKNWRVIQTLQTWMDWGRKQTRINTVFPWSHWLSLNHISYPGDFNRVINHVQSYIQYSMEQI